MISSFPVLLSLSYSMNKEATEAWIPMDLSLINLRFFQLVSTSHQYLSIFSYSYHLFGCQVTELTVCQEVSQHLFRLATWLLTLRRRIYNCLFLSCCTNLEHFPLSSCYFSQVCRKYLHVSLYSVCQIWL